MKGTPLPRPEATKGEIASALDGQTARLDLANGQKSDILAIVDQCKVRQQAVLKAILPKPPAWEVWRR